MDPEAFRAAAHDVVDLIADYLADHRGATRSCRRSSPGRSARCSRAHAPERPEPLDAILADVDRLVVPNATHWQHPGFLAYFATTASGPGHPRRVADGGARAEPDAVADVADRDRARDRRRRLAARGARAAGDVRRPAHRHGLDLDADRARGGPRGEPGSMRRPAGWPRRATARRAAVYASAEAHSSIEKAAMTLGLGRAAVGKIPVDDDYAMDVEALATAIAEDRAAGRCPIADRRHGRHDVVDLRRPGRGDRRRRRARGPLAARRRRLCRAGRAPARAPRRRSPAGSAPTRSSSTRTSGCSRRSTPRCC